MLCVCCVCRSLQFGGDDQQLSATEVTELVQEDSTQHVFHFTIVARSVQWDLHMCVCVFACVCVHVCVLSVTPAVYVQAVR